MLLRLAGGLLVCLSCTLLGLYMAEKGLRRAALMLELKRTLLMLKSEIEYAIYPLPQAFANISSRAAQPFGDFYSLIVDRLASKEQNIAQAWEQGLDPLAQTQLCKEDLAVIKALGRALGNIDAAAQISAIGMTVLELDSILNKLDAENAKNVKMYRGLGILGGLLITVVLL